MSKNSRRYLISCKSIHGHTKYLYWTHHNTRLRNANFGIDPCKAQRYTPSRALYKCEALRAVFPTIEFSFDLDPLLVTC